MDTNATPTSTSTLNSTSHHDTLHRPPSIRPILPLEILDDVCRRLPQKDLTPFVRANSVFREISYRILYHTIESLSLLQSIRCLKTLANNQKLCSHVRTLDIDWHQSSPTTNLYHLLHRILKRLTSLTNLSLEFPRQHDPFFVLSACSFSLKHFVTSLHCNEALAQFLDSQPSITELSLRGYGHDEYHAIPFLEPFLLHSYGRIDFSLPPTALPNLVHFRTVHGRPSVIAAVVTGRPVQMASIPLFPSRTEEALEALGKSTLPIRRLSVMSFDPSAHEILLSSIAEAFPDLEALHIVALLTEYSNELLEAAGPSLRGFRSLQYITFMAPIDDESEDYDEQAIAKLWHDCCPTLKTIILPKGKVWFQDASKWTSLDD